LEKVIIPVRVVGTDKPEKLLTRLIAHQFIILMNVPNAVEKRVREKWRCLTTHRTRAARWQIYAKHKTNQSALAGSLTTDDAVDVPRSKGKRAVFNRRTFRQSFFGDVVEVDEWSGGVFHWKDRGYMPIENGQKSVKKTGRIWHMKANAFYHSSAH